MVSVPKSAIPESIVWALAHDKNPLRIKQVANKADMMFVVFLNLFALFVG